MLHFLSGLYTNLFTEPEYHVLIIGHEASGKTTLLEQLKYMYSEEPKPHGENSEGNGLALLSNDTRTTSNTVHETSDEYYDDGDGDEASSFRSLRSAIPWAVPPNNNNSSTHPYAPSTSMIDGRSSDGYPMHRINRGMLPSTNNYNVVDVLPLPAGTPLPASVTQMRRKHIRPTVGMNLASLTHRFAPLVLHVAPPHALRPLPSPSAVSGMTPHALYDRRNMNGAGATSAGTPVHTASASSASSSSLATAAAEESLERRRRLTTAVRSERTRLQLWDLGGQLSLRALWSTYFPQCQAVIFVLDSTLPFTASTHGDTESTTRKGTVQNGTNSEVAVHTTGNSSNGLSMPTFGVSSTSTTSATAPHAFTATTVDALAIRQALRGNRATLQRLLLHPQLQGVPFLVLSNKIDQQPHLSLAEVQEGLGMASLAARQAFYAMNGNACDDCAPMELSTSTTTLTGVDGGQQQHYNNSTTQQQPSHGDVGSSAIAPGEEKGGSGFGNIVWKLAEISALDGAGVAPAMDWLVTQLLRKARTVDVDNTN